MGEETIVNEEKTKRRGSFSVRFTFRRESLPTTKELRLKTNEEPQKGSQVEEENEDEVVQDSDGEFDNEPQERSGSFSGTPRSGRFALRRDSLPLATIRKAWLKGRRSISPESFNLWRRRYVI